MFKSYDIYETDYGGVIKIVDTDFIEEREIAVGANLAYNLGKYVIKIYEDRGLPVASNLVKAFLFRIQEVPAKYSAMKFILSTNEKMNPLYLKYKEQVDRLLVLI
jgi:hypothetical protein